jgi:hypothetical protein
MFIGFPIWCGIYFGIYFPIEAREWETSTCLITDRTRYETEWEDLWHVYIQYKVAIHDDGELYPGYACESSGAKDRPD